MDENQQVPSSYNIVSTFHIPAHLQGERKSEPSDKEVVVKKSGERPPIAVRPISSDSEDLNSKLNKGRPKSLSKTMIKKVAKTEKVKPSKLQTSRNEPR